MHATHSQPPTLTPLLVVLICVLAPIATPRWALAAPDQGAEASGAPQLTFGEFGGSGKVTRKSYVIRKATPEQTKVYVIDSSNPGAVVMVVGGMHGNEPSGYMAAARIAHWSIDAGTLVVIPWANAVAIRHHNRTWEEGDLNRHFPSGEKPESELARAIWKQVLRWDPDFVIDLHSARGLYLDGDGESVGQAIFPTRAGNARKYARKVRAYLNRHYVKRERYRFTGASSPDGSRDMLKHKVAADLGIPAVIIETYDKQGEVVPLRRQVMWHLAAVDRFLELYGLIRR